MTSAEPVTVGERIAQYRKRLGMSQVEFAERVGRSESWVSQVERGVRPVDRMSVLQTVADVLGVPVGELRGDQLAAGPVSLGTMASSAELFERAEFWRSAADEALLEAQEHDKAHIASTQNPWNFRMVESTTLHDRIKLYIWMAELSYKMAVDQREQEERAP